MSEDATAGNDEKKDKASYDNAYEDITNLILLHGVMCAFLLIAYYLSYQDPLMVLTNKNREEGRANRPSARAPLRNPGAPVDEHLAVLGQRRSKPRCLRRFNKGLPRGREAAARD